MNLRIDSNNKVGAPEGNENARKGKMFYDQLRKVLVQNDSLKLRMISEKLVDAAIQGEAWAVKEVMDRMDGKPVATQEITGAEGAPLLKGVEISFIEPNARSAD